MKVTGTSVVVDGSKYVEVSEGTASVLFPADGEVFYNPVQEFNRDLSIAVYNRFSKLFGVEQVEKRKKLKEKQARRLAFEQQEKSSLATSSGSTSLDEPKSRATDDNIQSAGVSEPHDDSESYPGITICEALSATGLRAIRYANEIDGVQHVIANDMSAPAVEAIRRNVVHNKLDPVTTVIPNEADAAMLMYGHRKFKTTAHCQCTPVMFTTCFDTCTAKYIMLIV